MNLEDTVKMRCLFLRRIVGLLLPILEERNFRNEKSMVQYFRSYQRDKWIIEKEQNKSHVG